jgi:hypothetical protein
MSDTKSNCKRCGAEIQAVTPKYYAGQCWPCYSLTREIAWRRSQAFVWLGFVLPAVLIILVVWRLLQQEWAWGWALLFLVPRLLFNFKLRGSTERPGC